MATYIYIRVSTEHQDYISQEQIVRDYIERIGMAYSKIKGVITEKISGAKKAQERELSKLISMCEDGDIIVTSELSRFGRDALDVENTLRYCNEHGISIHFIHENIITKAHGYDFVTELMLKILAAFKERERRDMLFRQAGAYRAIKEKLARGEEHISRTGRVVKKLGTPGNLDHSAGGRATAIKNAAAAMNWRKTSPAFRWVVRKFIEGKRMIDIVEEFNFNRSLSPDNMHIFCTQRGLPLTLPTVKQWYRLYKKDIAAGITYNI